MSFRALAAGLVTVAAVVLAVGGGAAAASKPRVHVWTIHYRAHDGTARRALVILPAGYGPRHNPRIPLVISPHGRGLSGRANVALWGNLPAAGGFAVVNPDGEGRKTAFYSWGYAGQIDDLAKMPELVHRALPWLRIDRHRVYAFGGSMGGQESLLLVASHPRLLAGAAVFDSVTDLALQYRDFPQIGCNAACRRRWGGPIGTSLQSLARLEVGGSPGARPGAYARRSPLAVARKLAFSGVPLQFWWSSVDTIVINQAEQSERLFRRIGTLNRKAPVEAFVGTWAHSQEMDAQAQLPFALATFSLLTEWSDRPPPPIHLGEPVD